MLERLAASLESRLAPMGWRGEARPYKAHTTLGRVKSRRNLVRLCSMLKNRARRSFGFCEAEGLTLFRSVLTSDGSHYEVLSRHPFLC